ncbi:Subtilisin-like protease [Hordeum vulgare]|nr:Subtilisin-like protease [Hordeum vulgare]
MDGDPTNPGDKAAAARLAVKKKGPRKPRSDRTSEEIVKLDVDSANRRGQRAKAKELKVPEAHAVEANVWRQARHLADVEKESIVIKGHALIMLVWARPAPTILPVVATAAAKTGLSSDHPP